MREALAAIPMKPDKTTYTPADAEETEVQAILKYTKNSKPAWVTWAPVSIKHIPIIIIVDQGSERKGLFVATELVIGLNEIA